MPAPADPPDRHAFAAFLELLRHEQQVALGVDHYLRLERVLSRIDASCAPEDVKTLLCPLFATNPRQQEAFYRAFDRWYPWFRAPAIEHGETVRIGGKAAASAHVAPAKPMWWRYFVAAAVLVVLIGFSVHEVMDRSPDIREAVAPKAQAPPAAAKATTPSPSPPTPPVTLPAEFGRPSEPAFWLQHWYELRVAATAAPLILLLVYEWYRSNRRRFVVDRQAGTQPPFVWPLHVTAPPVPVGDRDDFLTATRRLRGRQPGEGRRLDVEATVSATIEASGFPTLEYTPDTRVPEYLVLIARESAFDHQARRFEQLVSQLSSEGLFVVRYFYAGDPRVCWADGVEGSVSLEQLLHRYGGHRLLLMDSGYGLLDPVSGTMARWAGLIEQWRDRALLTPVPPSAWSLCEAALAGTFALIPATTDGLIGLVNRFERTQEPRTQWWRSQISDPPVPDLSAGDAVAAVRQYLGPDLFQWLCACAVYPELQWDLTLYLGALLSMPAGLVTEVNLLRLIRLPWFRSGEIPADVRLTLLRELDPAREAAVRAAIVSMLERDPAPHDSAADKERRLQIAVQRAWMAQTHRQGRGRALRALREFSSGALLRDRTVVRLLETMRGGALSGRLPQALRRGMFRHGLPALGMRTAARSIVVVALMVSAWVGIQPPGHPYAVLIALAADPATEEQSLVLMAEHLRSARGGGVPAANFEIVRDDGSAIVSKLSGAIGRALTKAGPRSTLYVYGTGEDLSQDADDAAIAEGWRLLPKAWAAGPRRLVVFLDAPTASEVATQLTAWRDEIRIPRDFVAFFPSETLGQGDLNIAAGTYGGVKARPDGHGALTSMLVQGLQGAADGDQNRRVTIAELQTYVTNQFQLKASDEPASVSTLDAAYVLSDLNSAGIDAARLSALIAPISSRQAGGLPDPLEAKPVPGAIVLRLELQDVYGDPIRNRASITVTSPDGTNRREAEGDPSAVFTLDNSGGTRGPLRLIATVDGYRPVGQFVNLATDGRARVQMTLPVDPRQVRSVRFPEYKALSAELKRLLENSYYVAGYEGKSGEDLYSTLAEPGLRASLLNIAAKAGATALGSASLLSQLKEVISVQAERLLVSTDTGLRSALQQNRDLFAPATLSKAPDGWQLAGSFKTADRYASLQVTCLTDGKAYRAVLDIDISSGIKHIFQVLDDSTPVGRPYDVHEILVAFQQIDPGYRFDMRPMMQQAR